MSSDNPIVRQWLNGEMDAGGTIAALEQRVKELEANLLFAMDNWHTFAAARLGVVRDSMTPSDIEAVQNFLERATLRGAR